MHSTSKKLLVFTALLFVSAGALQAEVVMFRPNATVGFFTEGDKLCLTYSYGGMILLMANTFQRYGVLVNYLCLKNANDDSFLSTGIALEQVMFRHFNMGIGTVGYIGLGKTQQTQGNPFGIWTSLGYEYRVGRVNFLAATQGDIIFARQVIWTTTLLLGVGVSI